jgi:peptide/nickel transport system permease protein
MSLAEAQAVEIQLEQPTGGLWREAWYRLTHNVGAIVGAVIVLLFVFGGALAPWIAPAHPSNETFLVGGILQPEPPSTDHLLGLDIQGRDVLSRIVYGARYSLLIAVVSVAIGLSVGLVLGAVAGYLGGFTDSAIMRLMDIMLAIPGLLFAIAIVAMLGPGLWQVIIAVGVVNIPIFARLLRGSVLAQRENDYVLAARSVGVRRKTILASHILPNSMSPLIVAGTLAMATAIIDVAGLGFLGLGPQDPSTPEWGTMLTDVNEYLAAAPYLAIIPGLCIVISVLGFNLIGDGLREALDPKLRVGVDVGVDRG